jgi:hypothetical protein
LLLAHCTKIFGKVLKCEFKNWIFKLIKHPKNLNFSSIFATMVTQSESLLSPVNLVTTHLKVIQVSLSTSVIVRRKFSSKISFPISGPTKMPSSS